MQNLKLMKQLFKSLSDQSEAFHSFIEEKQIYRKQISLNSFFLHLFYDYLHLHVFFTLKHNSKALKILFSKSSI